MRIALAVVVTACASAPSPIVVAPRGPVLVRMARPADALPRRDAFAHPICAEGAVADELVEPLVAFAREHLVRDARAPIRVQRHGRQHAPWRDGTVIRVDPRATTSGLSVATIINGYSSGKLYCAYVQRHGTLILVREDGAWVQ